jgi:hypothetical protein
MQRFSSIMNANLHSTTHYERNVAFQKRHERNLAFHNTL